MNKHVSDYLKQDKKLMPIKENRNAKQLLEGRLYNNWTKRTFTKEQVIKHKGSVGWVLGDGDLVIDVDPRNGGDEAFFRLCKNLNINLFPTVLTPRGGFHVYLKCSSTEGFPVHLKEYGRGVEFLKKGKFVFIAGCEEKRGIYEFAEDGFTQIDASAALIEVLSNSGVINKKEHSDDTTKSLLKKSDTVIHSLTQNKTDVNELLAFCQDKVDESIILQMLNKLDASMHHDEWVQIGMALHNWDEVEGLKLWEEWSKKGDNYEEGATQYKWKSFKHVSTGVTLGSLFYKAKEADYQERENELDVLLRDILTIKEQKKIWLDIPKRVKKLVLTDFDRERVISTLQTRLKDLTNVKPKKKNIIETFFNDNQNVSLNVIKPLWCEEWVYVLTHDAYVHIDSLRVYKQAAFNLEVGASIPLLESGGKQTASKFVSDNSFVGVVDEIGYMPQVFENIIKRDGKLVLNSFKHRSMPECAVEYTKDGLEAVNRVKTHIKRIFKHKEHEEMFLMWLAHQVQYPGVKIFWAPILQGAQGVGKSFFGELLRKVLGETNVNLIPPKIVIEKQNGWATGVCVNVLEELRISGHNRHEAVNELKPLITDSKINIREMYKAPFNTYNTTNYICFTNFKDAIPVDLSDRRWWVIFVDKTTEEITLNDNDYFTNLFNGVREYAEQVKKWLMSVDISEEFKHLKKAPMTVYKEIMVRTEEANIEGLYEVSELIKRGGRYYNADVISSADLFDDLAVEHLNLTLNTRKRNSVLKHLGYMQIGRIKIDNYPRRIWAKFEIHNDEIRKALKGTK